MINNENENENQISETNNNNNNNTIIDNLEGGGIKEDETTTIELSIGIATVTTIEQQEQQKQEEEEQQQQLFNSTENTINKLEELLNQHIIDDDDDNNNLVDNNNNNSNSNSNNNNNTLILNKKEILGVLLVDSFSNFYIQDSIIFSNINSNSQENSGSEQVNNNIGELKSPTTIIGNGFKDNEITSFLMNAFIYLSIPMTVLNYLLLTNKTSIKSTPSTSSSKPLSKVSSYNSLQQLQQLQSPTLLPSTDNNNNNNNNENQPLIEISSPSILQKQQQQQEVQQQPQQEDNNKKEKLLPNKVDKNIIFELEVLYDHHYSMEIFEYSKKISQAHNDIDSKCKLYFQYLSDLTKRSLSLCPPKYFDLITSSATSSNSPTSSTTTNLTPNQIFYKTIRESMEFFLVQNLFHHLFQVDYDLDYQFSKRIESLKFIELSHLGVSNELKNKFTKELCTTIIKLNVYQTPIDKQRCLARTIVKLLKLLNDNGNTITNTTNNTLINGEETLLPNLIYLILQSNPPNLYSNYKYLEKFIDHETQNSIYEYSFLLFSMAIQFIEKLDYNHLSIDPLYFQSKILEYNQKNNIVDSSQQQQQQQQSSQSQVSNSLSVQFSNLLINDPELSNISMNSMNNNNNNNIGIEEQFNFLTDNENRFKLFKDNYRIQNMIELCKSQISDNEIEELLLKFISISLIKENPSYHSMIRYSLKRFFIYYLGIDKNIFLSTEMHTIGALQDDYNTNELDVLPNTNGSNGGKDGSGGKDGETNSGGSSNKDKAIKTAKIVGAGVTGAVLVGMTGGLAAPFVFGMLNFVGAGGLVAGITGATGLSGATMLSVIFGAAGAKVTAGAMISATSGVKDYQIHKIKSQTSLHAIIGVFGLCTDVTAEYYQTKSVWDRVIRSVTDDYGDIFIVEWERDVMLKLKALVSEYQGTIVQGIVRSAATNIISQSLASALVPLSVLKAASVIDNPWSLLKDRSEKAGKVLAQQIIDGYFGNRPLTLISTSMGSRMVFYALEELYNQSATNPSVFSLIESVVFIGSPITSDQKRWGKILKLLSGRLVNCYTPNDMLLKYVCRSINCLSDGILPAAGVAPIHIPGSSLVIENVDLSNLVKSHLDYEKEEILCKILQHIDINNIKYCLPKISPLYSGKVYEV